MSNVAETERAWADISLPALIANGRTAARISGARLLPMVKANGYGLGGPVVARALEALDPWGFGVATVAEGLSLRAAGISRPILVFTPLEPRLIPHYLSHDLRPTIGDVAGLMGWLAQTPKPFHVEIDTGMSRSGFRWDADSSWRELVRDASGLEGAFTHFHSAESDEASLERQWTRLHDVIAALPRPVPLIHAANSAAALRGRAYAGSLVRPGIFLYGGAVGAIVPEPVVRLQARVISTRTVQAGDSVSYGATWTAPRATQVATLGIGYADGVPRSLSNAGVAELGGRLTPMVGRVTMDFTMVAAEAPCEVGEIATIYGGQVSLDEQARRAGTISYELLTSLGGRLPRRYC